MDCTLISKEVATALFSNIGSLIPIVIAGLSNVSLCYQETT